MAIDQFQNIYRGRKVIITGHTGFKGSWLTLWLTELGAKVVGVSNPITPQYGHFEALKLNVISHFIDIRDIDEIKQTFKREAPEIVFHLAAQPLVRKSYEDPIETWHVNTLGTANVLEACRNLPSLSAVVAITTDKVYQNEGWCYGYRELDRLGGHDPYSASKAACEILIESYRKSFFQPESNLLLASARSGNVIGGGDWAQDRLIPDIVRTVKDGKGLHIRYPNATRPWQHVLDPLSGYLLLGQKLLEGDRDFADAWNFGPNIDGNKSVTNVLTKVQGYWPEMQWSTENKDLPYEAGFLFLDIAKARTHLLWTPTWDFEKTIQKTVQWYKAFQGSNQVLTREQLSEFIHDAAKMGVPWCRA